jgi:hypothetical protein
MSQHTDERKKNILMNDNLNDVITESMKNSQQKCNHCEHQSIKNAAKEQLHLKACRALIEEQERKQTTLSSRISTQLFITSLIRSLNQAQIAQVHRAIVMFIYMIKLSFNHFENSYVIIHHQILQSDYKSSNRKLVNEKLLNEAYETIKQRVIKKLNACNHLNFFIDETISIRKERVINFCCHVFSKREFYLKATIEIAEKMNAIVQIE